MFLFNAMSCFADSSIPAATYVGGASCTQCHAQQANLWQGSHHDLAMQHADDTTVLGDFADAKFTYTGITSKFFKNDKKFMVRTDGPDGKLHDYEIRYTFGVTPLQQYLVEFGGGRLQALSIAWDTRPKAEGGQRWFHLYPDEKVDYRDELHWTRTNFNWNGMCAECHSTNLKKNYHSQSETFDTSWSDINVSCEACHGPASNHLIWAKKQTGAEKFSEDKGLTVLFDERKGVHWQVNAQSGKVERSQPRVTHKEIDVCAQCHSRRSATSADYSPGKPFLDHYMPRLLDEGMYYADGQIQQEVYVYGSFLQSRMQHQGVTCSDCHEPHSLKLRQPGNAVCLQCHAADKYNNKKHHFHPEDSSGASCAECHMPATTYMVVDPRHDHSIRIPRPDLSLSLGTPNACNKCHQDKDAAWAAAQVKQWYGKVPVGFQQYAEALDAGRQGKTDAAKLLVQQIENIKTPDIARASAVAELSPYLDQANIETLQKGLQDESALVRIASLGAAENIPLAMRVQMAFPLLSDPVRSVRIEAARVLAMVPAAQLSGDLLAGYTRATDEYIESQQVNADRPEAQFNLGNFYVVKADYAKAEHAYQQAIKLEASFLPAYINLADLYRAQQDDIAGEKVLRKAIEIAPENADVHYVLGLLLIRQKQNDKAIEMLQRAAELNLANARYIYVYAVALNSTGNTARAIEVLQEAQKRFPQDKDILETLVVFHRDAGNEFASQTFQKKLEKLNQ
jgi:tetratricopeptide (TPR) repeat protein